MPPELAEFWPWAIGGQAMDYKAMGQQRGVAREDFSGGMMLELSPKRQEGARLAKTLGQQGMVGREVPGWV